MNDRVRVRYIGNKPEKGDNVTGSKARWTPGSVVECAPEVAAKLFRHASVWQPADAAFAAPAPVPVTAERVLQLLEAGEFDKAIALRPSLARMRDFDMVKTTAAPVVDWGGQEALGLEPEQEPEPKGGGAAAGEKSDPEQMLHEYLSKPAGDIVAEAGEFEPALAERLLRTERASKQPRVTVLRALEKAAGE